MISMYIVSIIVCAPVAGLSISAIYLFEVTYTSPLSTP